MIIDKKFLDAYLGENLKDEWRKWAYANLIGLDPTNALTKVSNLMAEIREKDGSERRNELVVLYRSIHRNSDFGFKEGEEVYYLGGKRKVKKDVIEIMENNCIRLDNGITCPTLLEKIVEAEEIKQENTYEQVELEVWERKE